MQRLIPVVLVSMLAPFAFADHHQVANAIKADPRHYTVEFENDAVRIVRIKYGPGEASVMHSHDANCAIFLQDGKMRMTLADGTSEVPPTNPTGSINCTDADVHLPSNEGDTSVELVLVEMKGRKTLN